MALKISPLGAGTEVGRSCIVTQIGPYVVMFDCGLHMGFTDERRFPAFAYIQSRFNRKTPKVDLIVISHFHMDHIGGLVHYVERVCRRGVDGKFGSCGTGGSSRAQEVGGGGFTGPIIMTTPTLAISRLQLEDSYKLSPQNGTLAEIYACLNKVTTVNLHEEIEPLPGLKLTGYYAGHVLGAAMFRAEYNGNNGMPPVSVLYTGDYNTTPDRHLGPAEVFAVPPCDAVITETTYATTIRDSKRVRERDFLETIRDTVVNKKGKVLIPVFALGRAQELCILVDLFLDRTGLGKEVPAFFSSPMVEKATAYYKMFTDWMSDHLRSSNRSRAEEGGGSTATHFDFKYIKQYNAEQDRDTLMRDGPVIVFSTPGMLHAGQSLGLFRQWCEDERNTVILPGFCVEGTVGHQVLTLPKTDRKIVIGQSEVTVNCTVRNLSFSAHADCKGILHLLHRVNPRHVVLVHGEKSKMAYLKRLLDELMPTVSTTLPANGVMVDCSTGGCGSSANAQSVERRVAAYHAILEERGSREANSAATPPKEEEEKDSSTSTRRTIRVPACLLPEGYEVLTTARGNGMQPRKDNDEDTRGAASPSGPLFDLSAAMGAATQKYSLGNRKDATMRGVGSSRGDGFVRRKTTRGDDDDDGIVGGHISAEGVLESIGPVVVRRPLPQHVVLPSSGGSNGLTSDAVVVSIFREILQVLASSLPRFGWVLDESSHPVIRSAGTERSAASGVTVGWGADDDGGRKACFEVAWENDEQRPTEDKIGAHVIGVLDAVISSYVSAEPSTVCSGDIAEDLAAVSEYAGVELPVDVLRQCASGYGCCPFEDCF